MSKRVVITGGAAITPIGSNWQDIHSRLQQRANGIQYMQDWEKYSGLHTRLAAPAIWQAPSYPRKKVRSSGRVAYMAIHSVDLALEEAGLRDSAALTGGEAGVSYGSSTGNVDALLDYHSILTNHNTKGITATTYIRSMAQTCAVNIGVFFQLTGRLLTTNTACTSGSLAIGLGFEAIREGKQKIMICGGAEELTVVSAAVFDTLYATSTINNYPKLSPKPFDKNRDGLVIGEGAGTLILEELEHAKDRRAVILGELVGFGTNTDGDHITQPNPETMKISLQLALDDADLDPDDIGYVNGHGTATRYGDIAESHATRSCLGGSVPFSTLKSYTGHTLGACGAIETWITLNMIREGWIAPNINLNEVDPQCAELDYISGNGRYLRPRYAMCNNFAFGGINTSLILKNWEHSQDLQESPL